MANGNDGFLSRWSRRKQAVRDGLVPPPEPAWGSMLSDGRSMLMVGDWWLTVFPGLCIILVVLATQLLGDWLRIRLDPQLRNL